MLNFFWERVPKHYFSSELFSAQFRALPSLLEAALLKHFYENDTLNKIRRGVVQ